MTIDDGTALSVAIEIALQAAPSITADMFPLFGFAGPVVSRSQAESMTSVATASIDDSFRMGLLFFVPSLTDRSRQPSHGSPAPHASPPSAVLLPDAARQLGARASQQLRGRAGIATRVQGGP